MNHNEQQEDGNMQAGMIQTRDRAAFRNIARQYAEVAFLGVHQKTMDDWKLLNALKPVRPLIMIDQIPWHEMNVDDELTLQCEDPFLRSLEWGMRSELYKWKHFPCDMAFFPYLQVPKAFTDTGIGVATEVSADNEGHASAQTHTYADQLADEKDLEKLRVPIIRLDKEKTAFREALVNELVGDILPVKLSGVGIWAAIWDRIVFWRGATPVLYDLADRPEFLHQLMRKLVDIEMGILDQYEDQGLLEAHPNTVHCAGAYSSEIPGSDFDPAHVKAKDCWAAGAAQIFSEVSPAMHDEFEIEYMKPYYERFGLVNYGCCEPLHKKIDIIRKIKTVRCISMSPWANVDVAAEAMGRDYVMARKPNPAFVAMSSLDEKIIEEETLKTLRACRANGTPCAFILKDITTVRNEPQRLTRWYETLRSAIGKSN
jgi:hypothetical protein